MSKVVRKESPNIKSVELLSSFNEQHFSHLNLGQTCVALILELKTRFFQVLNPITSIVCFIKGLADYIK